MHAYSMMLSNPYELVRAKAFAAWDEFIFKTSEYASDTIKCVTSSVGPPAPGNFEAAEALGYLGDTAIFTPLRVITNNANVLKSMGGYLVWGYGLVAVKVQQVSITASTDGVLYVPTIYDPAISYEDGVSLMT